MLTATNVFAAGWYKCDITAVTTRPDGFIVLKFKPAADETKFTGVGVAQMHPDDVGQKTMMATVLTGYSLGQAVYLNLDTTPSTTAQFINILRLLAN